MKCLKSLGKDDKFKLKKIEPYSILNTYADRENSLENDKIKILKINTKYLTTSPNNITRKQNYCNPKKENNILSEKKNKILVINHKMIENESRNQFHSKNTTVQVNLIIGRILKAMNLQITLRVNLKVIFTNCYKKAIRLS